MYNISMERQDVSYNKTSKYNQFNLSTQFINMAFYISKLGFSPNVPNRKWNLKIEKKKIITCSFEPITPIYFSRAMTSRG